MLLTESFILSPGCLIAGRYEVVQLLGSGAMGSVLKVLDRELGNKTVALKLLNPHLMRDERMLMRFKNEVLLTRELAHENIVSIYEFGHDTSGQYYITMEYIDGCNLRQFLDQHPDTNLSRRMELLRAIADGIHHAHSKGIIHRDLKPDNILVSSTGAVKITDFGIARRLDEEQHLTKTGEAIGTVYYMAPEQIRGKGIDHRADIYALGVLAHELALGMRPFEGESYFKLIGRILKDDIPPLELSGVQLPALIQDLIYKATAKAKTDRYASAQGLMVVLDQYLSGKSYTGALRVSVRKQLKIRKLLRYWSSIVTMIAVCLLLVLVLAIRTSDKVTRLAAVPILSAERVWSTDLSFLKKVLRKDFALTTPRLFEAIARGYSEELLVYLRAGADANTVAPDGNSLLQHAAESYDPKTVRYLLDFGARIDATGSSGRTPLLIAAGATGTVRMATVAELVARGANVHFRDGYGRSPLSFASAMGNATAVAILLQGGAELQQEDREGRTPLWYAVLSGNEELVRYLLRMGADPNASTKGVFPLLQAAQSELRSELLSTLLEFGADPYRLRPDGRGMNDVVAALNEEQRQVVASTLVAHGYQISDP